MWGIYMTGWLSNIGERTIGENNCSDKTSPCSEKTSENKSLLR
jgi:hypothetical protein